MSKVNKTKKLLSSAAPLPSWRVVYDIDDIKRPLCWRNWGLAIVWGTLVDIFFKRLLERRRWDRLGGGLLVRLTAI